MAGTWTKCLRVPTFADIPSPPTRGALYFLDNGTMWLADGQGAGLRQYGWGGLMGAPDRALRTILGALTIPSSGAVNSEWYSSELI
jgi:hypothetical protein